MQNSGFNSCKQIFCDQIQHKLSFFHLHFSKHGPFTFYTWLKKKKSLSGSCHDIDSNLSHLSSNVLNPSEKNPYETPFAASAPLHLFPAAEETNQPKASEPSPPGSSKGHRSGKHFLLYSLAAWAFLNLQELLKAKGMGNHPEKYKQGAGEVHAEREGTEKDYKEQGQGEVFLIGSHPAIPSRRNPEGILEKD